MLDIGVGGVDTALFAGAELRQLLEQTAETNATGLRMLHPANAVAAARAKSGNR